MAARLDTPVFSQIEDFVNSIARIQFYSLRRLENGEYDTTWYNSTLCRDFYGSSYDTEFDSDWICANTSSITVNNDVYTMQTVSEGFGMVVNSCEDAITIDQKQGL